MQIYSDLPREWPYKQVNRHVRTALWRRVAERALRGTYFGDILEEVRPDLTGDLLQISHAFATPLAELFAFVARPPAVFLCPTEATGALCESPVLAVWSPSFRLRALCL